MLAQHILVMWVCAFVSMVMAHRREIRQLCYSFVSFVRHWRRRKRISCYAYLVNDFMFHATLEQAFVDASDWVSQSNKFMILLLYNRQMFNRLYSCRCCIHFLSHRLWERFTHLGDMMTVLFGCDMQRLKCESGLWTFGGNRVRPWFSFMVVGICCKIAAWAARAYDFGNVCRDGWIFADQAKILAQKFLSIIRNAHNGMRGYKIWWVRDFWSSGEICLTRGVRRNFYWRHF